MRIIKSSTFFFFFIISICSFAQSPSIIDISNQQYALRSGFLKMGTNISPSGEVLSYNSMYLTRNGKPWFPIMGEMHFSQTDEKDWENIMLKMKAGGVEIIAVYIFWIHHEETEGIMDWSGNRNLHRFLALCKKHNMYVWLRPGPWIHAEARNGGFPDWLQNKPIKLRTNDSSYLVYSKKWFSDIAGQCEGYWYKQSGTIIGIQIENEMVFKAVPAYQHMKILKKLAIDVGMDVPYYSAFAQGPDDQDEFLYTLGGYPDSPWGQYTHRMYKPVFFIKPLEADSDIGSDLFGKVDTKVRNTYPKLSAELGSGMQKTYHRRVDVSAKDIGATALTRIASGLNGMGYFMYVGGHNPIGKTTMTESRITGYPNDMPYVNYDFQAPVGDMGIIRESYNELRLLNLFLHDFGEDIATEKAFFPQKRVHGFFSHDTVQVSARIHNNSGFIFLSNYQRFVDLPAVKGFQMNLINNGEQVNIPEKPIEFNANSYSIWPYGMMMADVKLKYATAQPLCILRNKDKNTYVFFANSDAEFVFEKNPIGYFITHNCSAIKENENIHFNILKDRVASFDIITGNEHKTIRIIVLPRDKALHASKIKYKQQELLVISKDNILWDDHTLTIEHISKVPSTKIYIFPKIEFQVKEKLFTIIPEKSIFPFVGYDIIASSSSKAAVHIRAYDNLFNPDSARMAAHYEDSIWQYYATSPRFNKLQPGPLYQPKFHNLPQQHLYSINFNTVATPLVKDWIADIHYEGDVMALYKNDALLYDQFNYNNHCNYKLSSATLKTGDKLMLQILPIKKNYDIYVEENMERAKENDWTKGILKNIMLTPVYNFHIIIK